MRRMTLVILALACSLAVAGVATSATTLKLTSDPHGALKFNKKVLRAKAGKVTIVMRNLAPLLHNIALKGKGVNVKGKIVAKGKSSVVTATLKKGRYTFYCSVPGHEAAGMKGTLIVT
jgi:uncharacterized cupredoxin-like copper-binding protein